MVNEGNTNQHIMEISGAASTAEHKEIQSLKKQLWRAKRDNDILQKAAVIFIQED